MNRTILNQFSCRPTGNPCTSQVTTNASPSGPLPRKDARSMLWKLAFFVFATFLLIPGESMATHFAGGEITYRYLSGTNYEVTLRLYRDCAGVNYFNPERINITPASFGQNVLQLPQVSVQEISPICPTAASTCSGGQLNGIEERVFRTTRSFPTLPNGQVYTLSSERCCRNFVINTLTSPGGTGWYITTTLDPNLTPRNSSPVFLNPPVAFLCVNQLATINPLATDPDGDVLQYSLVPCRDNTAGFPNVNYATGFSPTNPLTTTGGLTLDAVTGQLTFTPSQLEVGVICTRVEEFRNGTKIGEVIRDIQIQVQACSNNNPVITPISNQVTAVGNQLCVPVTVTDVDGDNLTVTAASAISPPAVFIVTSSAPGLVTGLFCWTPSPGDAGNTFPVSINASDDACPLSGSSSESFNITVPIACSLGFNQIVTDETCIGSANGAIDATVIGATPPISYNWFGPNGYTAITEDITGLSGGAYTLIIVDGNNCVDSTTINVNQGSVSLNYNVLTQDPDCGGGGGVITVTGISGGNPPYTYSNDGGTTTQASGTFANLAPGTYDIRVFDASGCASAIQTVTLVQQGADPLVVTCPGDTAIAADEACEAVTPDFVPLVTLTGGCPPVTVEQFPFAGQPIETGVTPVVLYVRDGNSILLDSCTLNVTVFDTVAPTLSPIPNDTTVACTDIPEAASVTALDNCPNPPLFFNETITPGNCPGNYTLTRRWTTFQGSTAIRDSQIVTVVDTVAPDIICPASITVSNDPGICGAAITHQENASDACGTPTVTFAPASGSVLPLGVNTVVGTATDECGNSDTCQFTVTVNDTEAPIAGCQDITITTTSSTVPEDVTPVMINNGSTDNCGIVFTGVNPSGFVCADAGPNTVVLTIRDAAGNEDTCQATVNVIDDCCDLAVSLNSSTDPSCPGGTDGAIDIDVTTSNGPSTFLWDNGATTEDLTGLAQGTYMVVVTDANSCTDSLTVTLTDTPDLTPPSLTCPTNLSLCADGFCGGTLPDFVSTAGTTQLANSSNDFAGIQGARNWLYGVADYSNGFLLNSSLLPNYTGFVWNNPGTTLDFPQLDANGGHPQFEGPRQAVRRWVSSYTGTVNLRMEFYDRDGSCGDGAHVRYFKNGQEVWQFFDIPVGAANMQVFNITETVVCGDILDFSIDPKFSADCDDTHFRIEISAANQVTASDACSGVVLTQFPAAQTPLPLGITPVTITATDAAGNTDTCQFSVAVTDQTPPLAFCQDVTINVDNNNAPLSVTATDIDSNSVDNCGIVSRTISTNSFGCADGGLHTVTLTLTDATGNFSQCTAEVNVVANCCNMVLTQAGATDPTCNGVADGTIDVSTANAAAPVNYLWSDGATTEDRSGLAAGTYTVVATDANNCTDSLTVTLAAPTSIVLTLNGTDPACNGESTGSVDLTVDGGTAPYTYAWSNGATSEDLANVPAGDYDVTVTDANACFEVASITLSEPPALLVSVVGTDLACNNDGSGSIDVSVSGGVGPYTYAWGDGSTAEDRSGLDAGAYSLVVTDANGCTANGGATLNEPSAIGVTSTSTSPVCPGDTDGTIDVTVTGGSAPYTYAWGDGATSEDRSGLGAGTYMVTVTDANNCTGTTSATITDGSDTVDPVVTCPSDITVGNDPGVCEAAVSYSASATDNCGTPTVTLSPASGSTFAVGTATVTATADDGNGNTASCTFTVTVNDTEAPAIVCPADVSVGNDPGLCSAVVTYPAPTATDNCPVGGPTPVSALVPGDIAFTRLKCDNPDQFAFVLLRPILSGTVINFTDNGWLAAGGFRPGEGDITWTAPSNLSEGTEIIIDNNNSANIGTVVVNAIISLASSGDQIIAFQGTLANPTLLAAVHSESATWNANAGTSNQSALPAGLVDGVHAIAIPEIDNQWYDCSTVSGTPAALAAAIHNNANWNRVNSPSTYLPVSCTFNVAAGGGLTPMLVSGIGSGGTFPVGVSDEIWEVADPSGNTAQCTVRVTVTDVEPPVANCQDITITTTSTTVPETFTAGQINNGSTDNCGVDSVSVTPSGFTCNDAGANTVTLTVTDVNGLTSTCTATVNVVDNCCNLSLAQANTNDPSCAGFSDGQIDISSIGALGTVSYLWSNGAVTEDLNGVPAGTYAVTATDNGATNCTATLSVTLTDPPVLAISGVPGNPLCAGDASGSIDVSATGGTPPYTYAWSNAAVTEDLSGVAAGAYTVTVTDANNCTAVETFNLIDPAALTASAAGTDPLCAGDASGNIDVTVSGGTAPYTYSWNDGATSEDRTGLAAGTYIVTVTDANNCSTTASATLTDPAAISASATGTDPVCNGESTGSVDLTVSGGTAPYTYLWSDGSTTEDLSGVGAGTYSVTITDANNCTATASATLTDPAAISATTVGTDPVCPGNANGSVDLTVSGGTAPYTYLWSNGATSEDLSGVVAGTYTVTITDVNNCTGTASATLVDGVDNVPPVANCNDVTIQLDANGDATVTLADLNGGATDNCGTPTVTGGPLAFACADVGANVIVLTATDQAGNTDTCQAIVTVEDNLPPTVSCDDLTVYLDGSGQASITAADVEGGSGGQGTAVITVTITPDFFASQTGWEITDAGNNVVFNVPTGTYFDFDPGPFTQDITVPCGASYNFTISDAFQDGGPSYEIRVNGTVVVPNTLMANGVTNEMVAVPVSSCPGAGGITDNCAIQSSGIDITAFTCADAPGPVTVTLTATDVNGNSSSCTSSVTVLDSIAPTIACPANITVNNDAGNCSAVVTYNTPVGTDNCNATTVLTSGLGAGATFPVGTGTETYTVTDGAGNTATCSFDVTVVDNEPPLVNCQDLTVYLDAAGQASITAGDVEASGGGQGTAVITVTITPDFFASQTGWELTDGGGNVVFNVPTGTYFDFDPGPFTQDITVNCGASYNFTISDAFQDGGPMYSIAVDGNVVVPTTTMANGVTNETVAVPVSSCPGTGGTSDNCAIASTGIDISDFDCADAASPVTVTFTATDVNGNSSTCTSSVTVVDSIAPVIACPTDVTVNNDAGNCSAVVTYTAPVGTDNCPATTVLTSGLGAGATFPVGTSTETYTVTDASGNTATCSFDVTVVDNEPPTVSCTDLTVYLDGNGQASITESDVVGGGGGGGTAVLTVTITPDFFASQTGWSITDGANNTVFNLPTGNYFDFDPGPFVQNITVPCGDTYNFTISDAFQDGGPTYQIEVDGNIVVPATAMANGVTNEMVAVPVSACGGGGGITDNCAVQSSGIDITDFDCSDAPGPVTVTLTATDVNGNTATCTSAVTVLDSVAPSITCPADVTVACGSPTDPAATGMATATDNCPNPGVAFSDATAAGSCPQESVITRTWTATDASGNAVTCIQTITIEDNDPPVFSVQAADLTVECDGAGNTTALNGWLASQGGAVAADACGNVTFTNNFAGLSDDCGETGTATVIFTASDECGNTATTSATFTIEDTQAPVVSTPAADLTVECDGSGNTADLNAWLAAQAGANASDDCSNVTWSNDFTGLTNGCGETGSATVTFTATDDCGNTATTSAIFTIEDTQAPTVACPADIVTGNDAGVCGAAVTYSATASDDCGTATVAFDVASGTVFNVGTTTVTATGTDECGNTANCSFTVTVNDTEAPTAICQDITVTATSPTVPVVVTAAQIDNNSSDNCGVANVSLSPASFTCSDAGPNTVTLTVTDAAGNVDTCSATVTVVDDCCDLILTLNNSTDPSCPGSADGAIDITATTSNGPVTFVWSNGATTEDLSGLTQGTYTVNATDANNCPATLTVTITDTPDSTAPVVICAADVTVNCGDDTSPAATGSATATDNCDPNPSVSFSDATTQGTCAANSVITRTWTATDASGNSATCVQTITTEDNTAPVVVCPADITVSNDPGVCEAVVNFTATATDDCGTATVTYSTMPGTSFSVGTATVTVTATDECGNSATCDFTVTVNDTEAPAIACPADITVGNDAGLCSADVTYAVPTVTDNCPAGGAGPMPISTLSAGDIAFTSMAVDNPDEFSFVLLTPVTASTQITFTDNGWFAAGGFRPGEGALTWTAGSVLAEGTEVTITNNAANVGSTSGSNLALAASGDQVLAYQGTSTAPTFIAAVHSNGVDWNPDATNTTTSALPTGLTDGVNAISIPEIDNMYYDCSTTSGTPAALAAAINDESNWQVANDRTGFTSVSCNFTVTAPTAGFTPVLVSGLGSGATFPVGTSTEVWVATDAAGNTDTCSFTITVNDTEAPVANCQDITVTANDPNIPVVVTSGQIDNNSTDNCGVASVSLSPSSFTCADAGANTVTLTVTDAAGNVDTCSATVTVIDNCCDLTLTLANATDPSCPGSSDGAIDITATTSNGPVTFVWSNGATTEDLSGLSQGTYTVNATDANGCPATLTVTITDTPDSTAPVVVCPADVTVNCDDDTSPAATGSATATDNCDPNPAISFSDATAAGTCPQEAVITRTWVVTDASGNTSTCGQVITIEDNVAPVITTQASDQTVECDGAGNTTALNGWLASQGGAVATDACGNVTWTNNFAGLSDDCGETGTATVIFTASDECGNTVTTTATFTIEDTQAPVVSTPAADLTVECDGSGNTADLNAWLAAQAGANASDDCSNVTWSNDFTGLTNGCGETGSATVTFTATDDCGNTATTSAIFTIEDTQAPTVACPADIVTGNDAGVCGAAVTYSATASDDCGTATVDFDVASGSVISVGTTTVTATATDECGNTANCSFTVTVNDTEAPTAICQDITVTATSPTVPVVVTAAQIDNNSSDNCGVASVTLSPASYTCNDAGPQTVVLTVTDAAGNVDSCTATVTVVDNCCDLILTLNNSTDPSCPGSSDGAIDITATTSNGPVTFVWSNGATTEDLSGLTQGTYTVNATDANGCPATLTVTITDTPDSTAPVVICAADVTVSCGDDTSPAATGSATATDNCDPNPSVSFSDATTQGTCAANSVITRTWTATDASGNTATCVQTITSEDNTAPVVVCPADIVVNNDPGVCDANVTFTATATDDCGTATVTYSVAPGSLFSLGTTTVTVTATDECGNTATCDFTVTVNDVEAPVIACPADITVDNDAGLCSAVVNYAVPTSTDNCPVGGTGPMPISTLSAGDIAFTSMAADNPDEFSFVLLTPVTAATQITFTDNGWTAGGSFRTGEGVLTWTAGSVLAEGTEVIINNNAANIGSTSGTNLALSSSGDAVLAYQGSAAAPTFIAAIHSNGTDWNPDATNTTTSALPTGLTDGVNAVSIPEVDNMYYDCSTTSGSPAALAAAINDDSNWSTDNSRIGFTPSACNFNVTAATSGLTPVLVSGQGSGGTFPVGTSTEVWAVSDASGNSDTCSFTITVNDTEAPVAICNDLTVQLDASGSATITAADVDGGSTDNCAVANVSIDNNTFDCSDVAVTPVVNDLFISEYIEGSGVNKAIEIYNGTGATVDLAAGGYSLDISFNGGTSSLNIPLTGTVADGDVYVLCDDGAGIPFLAQADQTTASNVWNGNDAITLRRGPFTLDIFGNNGDASNWVASSGQATTNQTLRRRGTVTAGVTVDPVGTGAASFTTLGTEWDMYPQDDFADLGSHSVFSSNAPMVTLTVTDASGNQSTCTAIVTVEDNVPPTAVCQDVTLQLDASGNAVLNAGQIDGGSTDNCGIATLDVNPTAFTCADVANGAVATLTVTDVNGNSSTCTSNVSVEDNVDPTAVCEDVTIFVDGTGNASTTASAIDGGSTDNCGIQSLSLDNSGFDCSDAGRILANGLFISEYVEGSSFEKYIEIYNGTGAAVNLADYELQLFRNGAAATTAGNSAALSGTLADGATIVYRNASATGPGTPLGTSTSGPISFNGDDAVALFNTVSGSFVDIIGVIGEDPGARWGSTSSNRTDNRTLRRNRTVTTGISVSPAVGNGATGFTTLDTEWTQFDQDDVSGLGSHAIALSTGNIVTLTVTDVSGNTDACTAVVTVLDTIDPTIACPADIVVGNDAGVCGAVVNYTVNSADNCSGDTLSLVAGLGSGATFPVGVSTESFTVTDAAGNTASCSFTVTVNDTEDPVVVCPADIVVSNDPGVCGANVTYAVTASDNCPGETLAQTAGLGSGSLFPVGTTTEAYTATDAAGNTASCSFTVTVNDTEDPVITCPADIVVSNDAGICGAAVNYTVNTSDNCTGETLTQNAGLGSGATFPVGVTTVSYTVTDQAGNTATCDFTVTVNDTEAPTIACPADITVSNDAGICGAVVTYSLTTSDNCAGETANLVTGLASGSTFPVGTTSVSYTAVDAAGNTSAACSFTVTVEDNEDPVIVCPTDIVVTAQPNDCDPAVTWTVPTPSDNCGIQSVSSSANSGDEFPVGTTTVTYTVTDVNGNTATCSFTVTVNALPLTASCSATDVTCGGNNDGTITATPAGGCEPYTYLWDDANMQTTQTATGLGAGTYTVTVTDANGQTATSTCTVNELSPVAATIGCCQDAVIQCGDTAQIVIDLEGTGPWTLIIGDGTSTFTVTANSTPYVLEVTPTATATYTLLSVSAANGCGGDVCGKATIGVNGDCPTVTCADLDFNIDSTFSAVPAGTIVDEQWAHLGVHISANNNRNNHPDEAIIFDSSNPTGGDTDLGTPNAAFGGPGVGSGGAAGQVGENAVALGNLLIIAENIRDNNGDGLVDNPDDEAGGGDLIFDFDDPVHVLTLTLVDLDDASGNSIITCSNAGGVLSTIGVPNLGDNSAQTITVNTGGVTQVKVHYTGSGAVSAINFCDGDPTANNGGGQSGCEDLCVNANLIGINELANGCRQFTLEVGCDPACFGGGSGSGSHSASGSSSGSGSYSASGSSSGSGSGSHSSSGSRSGSGSGSYDLDGSGSNSNSSSGSGYGSGPGAITAGSCGGCNSENTVVFNGCSSCVDVSSCKDLSNVVLLLCNGQEIKFDNLNQGKTGTFCSPDGQDILSVWVKSGCNQSGDGPGYGRRFDGPCTSQTCSSGSGSGSGFIDISVPCGTVSNVVASNGATTEIIAVDPITGITGIRVHALPGCATGNGGSGSGSYSGSGSHSASASGSGRCSGSSDDFDGSGSSSGSGSGSSSGSGHNSSSGSGGNGSGSFTITYDVCPDTGSCGTDVCPPLLAIHLDGCTDYEIADDSVANICTAFTVIDFEDDANGNALAAGEEVLMQYAAQGVAISVENFRNGHPDKGIIFDSGNPTGGDNDLGSPNAAFGGPGIGAGGAMGAAGENAVALGNVLIVAENDWDGNNDGLVDNPDDEARGGEITIQFAAATTVDWVQILDLDDGTGGSVMTCTVAGGSTVSVPIPNLGDNSTLVIPLNVDNVTELKIHFAGSGALAGFAYCDPGMSKTVAEGFGTDQNEVESQQSLETFDNGPVITAYPNPFREDITFEIELNQAVETSIIITDMHGKVVRRIQPELLEAGVNKVVWNGKDDIGTPQSNGVYFARIMMGNQSEVVKVILQK